MQRLMQYVKSKWFKPKAAENRSNDEINDEILEGEIKVTNSLCHDQGCTMAPTLSTCIQP